MWPAIALASLSVAAALQQPSRVPSFPLLVAHHKTGTVLAVKAKHCLEKEGLFVAGAWQGLQPNMTDQKAPIAVLVRNPFTIVASGYSYHKNVGEAWVEEKGSAAYILRTCKHKFDVNPDESYRELLNRLPQKEGLKAELCSFVRRSKQIWKSHALCESQPQKCIETCLEDFMRSSASYTESWNRVLGFLGLGQVTPGTRLHRCLAKQDLNDDETMHNLKHATAGAHPNDERHEMEEYLRSLVSKADPRDILRPFTVSGHRVERSQRGNLTFDTISDLEVTLGCQA